MTNFKFRRGMRLVRVNAGGKVEFARVIETQRGRVIVALTNGRETFPTALNPGWRLWKA